MTQTGSVQNFTMFIKKRTPLGNGSGETNTLAGQQWFYDFVDVPPGATNLLISVTNLTRRPAPAGRVRQAGRAADDQRLR